MNKWAMVNVVWYDAVDAYVSKFICKVEIKKDNKIEPTAESIELIKKYLFGNGEVLKIDPLYAMEFDNIVALKNYKDSIVESELAQYLAYKRFKELYF